MSELADAVTELLEEHRRIGSPVPEFVMPGHPEAEVRAYFGSLGLKPSAELVEYFTLLENIDNTGWLRVRPPGTHSWLWLCPPYELPGLDGVGVRNAQARWIVERVGPAGEADWGTTWATVLFTDRDSLAADCRGGATSVVWYQSFHPSEHPTGPVYPSVAGLIRDAASKLRSGAVQWTPEGFDWDRRAELMPPDDVIERARRIAGFDVGPAR